MTQYSDRITKNLTLEGAGGLVQRFCHNITSAPCPADIVSQLAANGFSGEGSGVALAAAFATLEADQLDGAHDRQSSPEIYLRAAYKVILAREPDSDGALVNLRFLKETGERQQLLRAMLQSQEFKAMP